MQEHPKIDMVAVSEAIARDLGEWAGTRDFRIISIAPFEKVYSATPDDVAEIEIRYSHLRETFVEERAAIYGVTAKGHATLYMN